MEFKFIYNPFFIFIFCVFKKNAFFDKKEFFMNRQIWINIF